MINAIYGIVCSNNVMKIENNFAIFLVFFWIAFVESIQLRNWGLAVVLLGLGLMSIYLDIKTDKRK